MAAAALRLPYFLGREHDNVNAEDRVRLVKKEVKNLVLGTEPWLHGHNEAFEEGAKLAVLFVPPKR
jgi:hypothetical protein